MRNGQKKRQEKIIMFLKTAKLVSLFAFAATAGLSLWARGHLPDVPMVTHYDLQGRANGTMPRDMALLFGPALVLGLALLTQWVLPAVMPKNAALERSRLPYGAATGACVVFVAMIHTVLILTALGYSLNIFSIILSGIGILFVIIGNYLPKTRFNYVLGVRNPWTLSDERVWDKTHRVAGPLFMCLGLGLFVDAFWVPQAWQMTAMMAGVLAVGVLCHACSYLAARHLRLV